jgi:hypothetical protein
MLVAFDSFLVGITANNYPERTWNAYRMARILRISELFQRINDLKQSGQPTAPMENELGIYSWCRRKMLLY